MRSSSAVSGHMSVSVLFSWVVFFRFVRVRCALVPELLPKAEIFMAASPVHELFIKLSSLAPWVQLSHWCQTHARVFCYASYFSVRLSFSRHGGDEIANISDLLSGPHPSAADGRIIANQ